MTPAPLHSLFERLFGGTDGAGRIDARHTAELAAGMEHGDPTKGELADNPERSTALLAAYLDGGLDDAAQQEVHARLSQSPARVHEVASADAFLEAMASAGATAPADLVTAIIARNRPATVSKLPPRRSFAIWKWSGVAVAVAVLAVLVIVGRQSVPTDTAVPVAVKSVPRSVADQMPHQVAKPQAPQRSSSPAMAPATSKENPPGQVTAPTKPSMAPEGFDVVPNNPVKR